MNKQTSQGGPDIGVEPDSLVLWSHCSVHCTTVLPSHCFLSASQSSIHTNMLPPALWACILCHKLLCNHSSNTFWNLSTAHALYPQSLTSKNSNSLVKQDFLFTNPYWPCLILLIIFLRQVITFAIFSLAPLFLHGYVLLFKFDMTLTFWIKCEWWSHSLWIFITHCNVSIPSNLKDHVKYLPLHLD